MTAFRRQGHHGLPEDPQGSRGPGLRYQETTRGYVLFFKDGKFITRYPKTPSSSRTIKNVLADLRRAGLQSPHGEEHGMWWSVYIEVADDDTEDPVSVEQLEKLADLLEPRSASVGGGGGQYSARLSVEAERDRAAADQALMEFAKAREKASLPEWPVVHLDLMTEERLDAELAEPPFPEVVGVAEAAKLLGVSKQRVLQLTERDDFPAPMVRLAAGPVWLAASIRAFDQRWSRKPGRPAGSMRDAADVSGTAIAAQRVFARSAARVRKPAAVAKSAAYAVKSSKTGKAKSGKGRKRDVGQD